MDLCVYGHEGFRQACMLARFPDLQVDAHGAGPQTAITYVRFSWLRSCDARTNSADKICSSTWYCSTDQATGCLGRAGCRNRVTTKGPVLSCPRTHPYLCPNDHRPAHLDEIRFATTHSVLLTVTLPLVGQSAGHALVSDDRQ